MKLTEKLHGRAVYGVNLYLAHQHTIDHFGVKDSVKNVVLFLCSSEVYPSNMDRLAPEDLQAIVSGVASNRYLITEIVAQLKKALQPTPPATHTQEGHQMHQPGDSAQPSTLGASDLFLPPTPATQDNHRGHPPMGQEELVAASSQSRSNQLNPPLPTQG